VTHWTLADYIGKNLSVLAELLEPEDVYAAQMAETLEALNAGLYHFPHVTSGQASCAQPFMYLYTVSTWIRCYYGS